LSDRGAFALLTRIPRDALLHPFMVFTVVVPSYGTVLLLQTVWQ
jgi:hypothetical protein